MSVGEIILEWVVFPLLDMVSGWNISGKWRISYLFPVATALGLGIWWLGDHFGIVLLKQSGSARKYRDKTFLLRNVGKVIQVRYSEEAIACITQHYGPLDFDLSDGREEQSQAAE